MGVTRFPHGISSMGVPIFGSGPLMTTGKVWFVHGTSGNDGNEGDTQEAPFKTIDYAVGKCTASQGDIILVMEGSNESITSTILVDVAGISIIGLGHGQAKAMITQATSGSDNVMEVSVANVLIQNIYFKGSTTGTSETFINASAAADNLTIRNCLFEQNTKNLIAVDITPTADYTIIEGCRFFGVGAGVTYGIKWRNSTVNANKTYYPIIRDCVFNYGGSAGCDTACIGVSMSSGTMVGLLIQDCAFLGLADGEKAINPKGQAGTTCTGLLNRVQVLSADASDVFVVSNVLGYVDVYAVQAGARPFGAALGSGMAPLLTTAA